jgi:SLOG in TRPM, prokaryote
LVVVPGDERGAESPWIAREATELAASAPSITVFITGGQIAYADVESSVEAGRRAIVIAVRPHRRHPRRRPCRINSG